MTNNLHTDRVLSTLNTDGTRRWIRPKLAHGRFLTRRRVVAYAQIALFVLLPKLAFRGHSALSFRPSDGFALAMLGLTIAFAVFLVTAQWGRVWCGWGCPQTVYLEHLFRPIERLFEGSRGQRATLWRRIGKWTAFSALSFALSNVFLAYFVGTDQLEKWVLGSPLDHPVGFGVVIAVSALMLSDFGWFREQMCTIACPYGRLQSVLLDKQSLIVGYDSARGEPRAQPKKKLRVIDNAGDCVDCGACVAVCPTGIDIREGLQMECTTCTQCIDACDSVMDKLGRKRGLIRYTSQDELAGKKRSVMRARTIVYPLLLALSLGGLVYAVVSQTGTEVWIERVNGKPFVELPNGDISAQTRLKLENATDQPRRYHLSLAGTNYAILRSQTDFELAPHKSLTIPVFIDVPRSSFKGGKRTAHLRIDDTTGFQRIVTVTLLGPES
jgi:cytochrome c oxidase accessory protein FixG